MRTRALATIVVVLAASAGPAAADALACRRAVGRQGTRYFAKAVSVLRKCEERRLVTPALVCPEATEASRVARLRARARSAVQNACSSGVPPEFPANCPDPCRATIGDADTLATCILCLADVGVSELLSLAYPRATVAVHTATPSPEVTPTATGSGPTVCGDGQVGPGEQCDLPDDHACPGRCVAAGQPNECQCASPLSCLQVSQPPGSCSVNADCPPAYACVSGECRAGTCLVKADCPEQGQCVYSGAAAEGTCVCRGCDPWDCPLGCELGLIFRGCRCAREEDCPPEDDVCFLGVCS